MKAHRQDNVNLIRPSHHRRLALIFFLLASIYLLTYSGRIESTDTLFLFDATESLLRFGDTRLDLASGVRPPISQHINPVVPLSDLNAEPLQSILTAPLYALANVLPGIGLVHTVYLFNSIVSALAGCLVFIYALTLGYDQRTATLAAFTFGLGTIIWPYSKTFFQEPLTLLLVLLAALLIERFRQARYRSIPLLLGIILAVAGALLTKSAALLALPGLLIVALPDAPARFQRRAARLTIILALLIFLALLVLTFGESRFIGRWFEDLIGAFRRSNRFMNVALHSYLFSLGGSIWGTSPVILLAVPAILLARRQRYLLVAVVMIAAFAAVYGLRQGSAWFGGLSWPPRFLIPAVPFALLAALPFLEKVARGLRIYVTVFAIIFTYSLWVQVSGVSVWWGDYAAALPPESNNLSEWGGGLNLVAYLRWVVIPGLWSQQSLDFAWVRTGTVIWPLLFGLLTALFTLAFFIQRRFLLPVAGLLFIFAVGFGLRSIYDDDFFLSFNTNLHNIVPTIQAETHAGDVVLLADLTYRDFFANYGKWGSDDARIVSLPFHPGEQSSPEQPPRVVSDNPDVLLHRTAAPLIHALAQSRERIWLLASSSAFIPWNVRPVERFMAAHYYPLREFAAGPDVRLIEYSTVSAPDPYAFRNPDYLTGFLYGDSLRLVGYDLPLSTTYTAGAVLPVSLYWRADSVPAADYKISLSLRALDGFPKAQAPDTQPAGDLSPTSTWSSSTAVWDNRALQIPPDLAPGDYQLWVIVYRTDPTGAVANLPATGDSVLDGFIGVLPTRITIIP